jgi:CubicO group peptidase (beta-lactamase class C family)
MTPAPAASAAVAAIEDRLLPPVLIEGRDETSRLGGALAEHKIPAVSIAVVAEGQIVWARAYGKAGAGGAAATADTLFQSCSISKTVATLTALRLIASGAFSLDSDVDALLSSWRIPENPYTADAPVTPRWLMSHRAGFNVGGFPGYAPSGPIPTLGQILRGEPPCNTEALRVEARPGSEFRYSGGGIQVLQQLLEDFGGLPYAELARSEVLDKAEMGSSTYEPTPSAAASGHDAGGEPMEGGYGIQPELAAAGLWSTPSDLARLAIAVQQSYVAGRGILPRSLAVEALTRIGDGPTGLGFFLAGEGDELRFSHSGGNMGFRCHLEAYASLGLGAVVMTNSDNGQILINRILNTIADAYGWPGFLNERKVSRLSEDILERYSGVYVIPFDADGALKIKVVAATGMLTVESPLGPGQLLPESETRFFGVQNPVEVEFHLQGGRAIGCSISLGGVRMEARREDSEQIN